jgi:hypothetical protein
MSSRQLSHKQRSNFKRRDDAPRRYNSSGYQGSNWQGGWGPRGNSTNNHYGRGGNEYYGRGGNDYYSGNRNRNYGNDYYDGNRNHNYGDRKRSERVDDNQNQSSSAPAPKRLNTSFDARELTPEQLQLKNMVSEQMEFDNVNNIPLKSFDQPLDWEDKKKEAAEQTKAEVLKMLEADLDQKIASQADEVSDPDESPDPYDSPIGGDSRVDKGKELESISRLIDALPGCLLLDLGFHCDPSG